MEERGKNDEEIKSMELWIDTAGATVDPSGPPTHVYIDEVNAAGATADLGGRTTPTDKQRRNERERGWKNKRSEQQGNGATVPIISPQSETTNEAWINTAGATEDPSDLPNHVYIRMGTTAGATVKPMGGRAKVPKVSPTSESTTTRETEQQHKKDKSGRRDERKKKRRHEQTEWIQARPRILWKDSHTGRGTEERCKTRAEQENEMELIVAHLRKKGLRRISSTPATAGNG